MASSYTTSLTLTKIGNGEQSGTWGTTTNTNWDLIEEAVAGVASVSVSGTSGATLSVANGVSDQARQAVIVVTGSTSGTNAIVAPLVKKVYVISNQTTGGFNITIGASSGSVVTVPNGVTTLVYCDGINFYSGITGFAGGNLSISGNITATGTITGSTFATAGGVPQMAGGTANQIPYQTGANATSYIAAPGSGSTTFLSYIPGTGFSWQTSSTTASNINGGSANALVYQSSPGTTTFLANPGTSTTYYLTYNNGLIWTTGGSVASVTASSPLGITGTTTAPNITLNGLVPIANGGTGATSFASAGLAQLSGATFSGNVLTSAQMGLSGTGLSYCRMVGSSLQMYDSNSSIYGNSVGSVGIVSGGYAPFASNGLGIAPGADNTYSCGISSLKWTAVWATNGAIQTSDARLKTNVAPSTLGLNFINKLNPVSYKWISGGKVEDGTTTPTQIGGDTVEIKNFKDRPGARTHYGLLAQEVKAVLDEEQVDDFAGWVLTDKDDPDSEQGLNYAQFIAPLIKAVQELKAEVDSLKVQLAAK